MELTKDAIKEYWKNKDKIFRNNNENINRFNKINELFDEILKKENEVVIDEENKTVTIGGNELKFKDGKSPCVMPYGPMKDETAAPKAYIGVENMLEKFNPEKADIINNIGCLLGGFDFEKKQMIAKYRIISNTKKGKNDNGTLLSKGECRHPSSNFADNNYFFRVMKQIQWYENSENDINKFFLVLRYPDGSCFGGRTIETDDDKGMQEICDRHHEVLKHRFPLKFLWMWANKEKVLHPFSLMSFRNLLKINIEKDADLLNCEIKDFPEKWKAVSNKICQEILGENYTPENIKNLSKLISIVTVSETDIKNIGDLLETGNKSVILWGPPGTGKTFAAKELVKEKLNYQSNEENNVNFQDEYLFSSNYNSQNIKPEHGYYEVIQFHPSYSYEDFIGGIRPKLTETENKISYELKPGIFKLFCDVAEKNKTQNFYFIIDEINRAELSAVFGELLYALEYRGESINLPYFEDFNIPENVYIIGTMNNVDKSLVTFDLALRRRFGFFKMMPNIDVLADVDKLNFFDVKNLDAYIERCKELNNEISNKQNGLMLGEDYQIGHAYFMKIKDFFDKSSNDLFITPLELEKLWVYHLEPLLEEYLGMSIEDDEMGRKLEKIKKEFVKPLETKNG